MEYDNVVGHKLLRDVQFLLRRRSNDSYALILGPLGQKFVRLVGFTVSTRLC